MKQGIYTIKNIITKQLYIGSAINILSRFNKHKEQLRKNKHFNFHLQNSWNKYGENNFLFNIEENIENKKNLIKKEQEWLDVCWPLGLYNIYPIAGSPFGIKRSEETKQKMSIAKQSMSDETKKKISEARKGKKFSKETKEKMRKPKNVVGRPHGREGLRHSEETKQKMKIAHKNRFFKKNMGLNISL